MIQVAAILVGGFGTRLKKLITDVPKPLAEVGGRPFLDHLLVDLKNQGIQKVILLAGNKSELFQPYINRQNEFGLHIEISIEPEPLGSAGALKYAERFFKGISEFIIINGDTYFEGSLQNLFRPLASDEIGRMGLCWLSDASRYGLVSRDQTGWITQFHEKKLGARGWVNTGFVVLRNQIFQKIPDQKFCSLEIDIYPHLTKIKGEELIGSFFDIGLPSSFSEFNSDLLLRSAFEKSKLLGHIATSWLENGQIFIHEDLGRIDLPGYLNSHVFSDQDSNGFRYCSARDLVFTKTGGRHKTLAFVLPVTKNEIEQIKIDLPDILKKLAISKGQHSLMGEPWRPGLFLDRDGVVIDFVDYIRSPDQVKLKDHAVELIERAHQKGWAVVVVTNQSGIGREYYSWSSYDEVTMKMNQLLAQKGQWIDRTLSAPYYEKSKRAYGYIHPSLRKPEAGMLLQASYELRIDLARSILVGDSSSDILAGKNAGLEHMFFLRSDRAEEEQKLRQSGLLCEVVNNLKEVELL